MYSSTCADPPVWPPAVHADALPRFRKKHRSQSQTGHTLARPTSHPPQAYHPKARSSSASPCARTPRANKSQDRSHVKMVLLDLLTLGLWSKLGRLVHYGVDAILSRSYSQAKNIPRRRRDRADPSACSTVSTILAGIRRSTGLTPSFKSEKIAGDSNETQKWVSRYLAVGETAMDWAVVTAGQSGWFERNR
ncbi:hypothetical protein FJTKL_13895 [Diaporthe vaccinii]|uniref:DUF1748 domain-containing protein n=1 Tax=Diaporthe vaccinii TaxID=105482 RepID=A0ABR4F995_9PEZI